MTSQSLYFNARDNLIHNKLTMWVSLGMEVTWMEEANDEKPASVSYLKFQPKKFNDNQEYNTGEVSQAVSQI